MKSKPSDLMTQAQPKPKAFRAQYKTFGLTYARCPIGREAVLAGIQKTGISLEEYYVVEELHADGGKHIHAWFKTVAKPNIRNCKYFDIVVDDVTYHPNIGNKKKNWVHNYLKKFDKTPLTNIEDNYNALARSGSVDLALQQFAFMHPKEFAINFKRVRQNFRTMSKKKKTDHVYAFTGHIPAYDDTARSLLLLDKPGSGKTEWAKSYVTHVKKKTYLRCTHIDSLKKYDGEDYIIWDDVSFAHLPRTTQIHLAEVRNSRDIHCRHVVSSIPPGVKNIFCVNEYPFTHDQPAIERRIFQWHNSVLFPIKYYGVVDQPPVDETTDLQAFLSDIPEIFS